MSQPVEKAGSRIRGFLVPVLAGLALLAIVWWSLPLLGLRLMKVHRPSSTLNLELTTGPSTIGSSGGVQLGTPAELLPNNLIVFVADGFGFTHLEAARVVLHGIGSPTQWDRFTSVGWQRTNSSRGLLTDSAAAATSLATGVSTYAGAIGVDDEGEPVTNLMELAHEAGYATGVVTDSYVWDATPASFAVHHKVRSDEAAGEVLAKLGASRLDLLVGELEDVGEGEIPDWDTSVELLSRRFSVAGPDPQALSRLESDSEVQPVALVFEEDQLTDLSSSPNLPELTRAALDNLSRRERPFVLMVEGEEPDSASHARNFPRLVSGLESIEETLKLLLDFAAADGGTLVVFTADHETGGLALTIGEHNLELEARWASTDHTAVVVPLMAFGPGAERFAGSFANWEVGQLLMSSIIPSASTETAGEPLQGADVSP